MINIVIDIQWCKGCGLCIEECNKEVLEWSGERNNKGYYFPRIKNPDRCTNCERCIVICPELAISNEEVE